MAAKGQAFLLTVGTDGDITDDHVFALRNYVTKQTTHADYYKFILERGGENNKLHAHIIMLLSEKKTLDQVRKSLESIHIKFVNADRKKIHTYIYGDMKKDSDGKRKNIGCAKFIWNLDEIDNYLNKTPEKVIDIKMPLLEESGEYDKTAIDEYLPSLQQQEEFKERKERVYSFQMLRLEKYFMQEWPYPLQDVTKHDVSAFLGKFAFETQKIEIPRNKRDAVDLRNKFYTFLHKHDPEIRAAYFSTKEETAAVKDLDILFGTTYHNKKRKVDHDKEQSDMMDEYNNSAFGY